MEIIVFVLLFALLGVSEYAFKNSRLQRLVSAFNQECNQLFGTDLNPPASSRSSAAQATQPSRQTPSLEELNQRIQTLEAIVTDPAYELRQKIDRL